MFGITDTLKNNILNFIFNKNSGNLQSPDHIKLALVSYNPTDKSYNEVSTRNTGYTRQLVKFTESSECTLSNSEEIQFPKSIKRWGQVVRLRLYAYYTEDDSNEELIYEIDLLEPRVIESGCNVTFNANSLTINLK